AGWIRCARSADAWWATRWTCVRRAAPSGRSRTSFDVWNIPASIYAQASMSDSSDLLPASTAMSAVTLKVADLDAMVAFYHGAVGLTVLDQTGPRAVLGRDGRRVVVLESAPELTHAPADHAGLFHTAVVFRDRADLAAAVYNVATRYPGLFTGSSDHL